MASSSSSSQAQPAVDPRIVLFARGVIAILDVWPALRLAVTESWGGAESAEKRRWMASILIDPFEEYLNTPSVKKDITVHAPDAIYIEEMLLQVMDDEFGAVIEDGSAEKVAKDVVGLWGKILISRVEAEKEVGRLESVQEALKKKKVEFQQQVADDDDEWSDEDSGDEEGDEDEEDGEAPMLLDGAKKEKEKEEDQVDEDGFTTVKKGKSHR
ncbi:hypothetical protein SISSUDRAFT_1028787 [Sistotremastrum suecicum HHB10207 ss-3]|uniref:Pre-rRNA-processing protein TSR2 n=1 Tax=Sistotremastrum suecicum HHB10207 ss-3 TaxID=1314776 RepID=A0A165XD29_9AGAM|nr:hypothetical protein SISSUDRAFT_1028787 [Sistotremastrum suecicum HHB10207 ss-3]